MTSYYNSYLNAFHNFARKALNNKLITTVTRYALIINLHANQLIHRAALNKLVSLPVLQTEIFEAGRDYIQKFLIRLKLEKVLALKKLDFNNISSDKSC